MLQHLAGGRVDLMMGRGNTGPVYPWFGQDIRNGIPLAYRELRAAPPPVARGRGRLAGPVPDAADRLHLDAAAARRRPAVRVARLDPQPGDRRAGRLLRRRLLPQQHLLAEGARPSGWSTSTGERFEHYGHGPADQAIVGLGGQVFMRPDSPGRRPRVPAVLRPRAGLRRRPVARGLHGPDAADRRQPAAGHRPDAGLPRVSSATTSASCSSSTTPACRSTTVLEQLEMLGELVVPVLRREFAAVRARRTCRTRRPTRACVAGAARSRPRQAAVRMATPTRSLVVVSAGLEPAVVDAPARRPARAAATDATCATRGVEADDRGHRAARPRPGPREQPADRLPEPALQAAIDARRRRRRADRGDADLQRLLQRAVQDVLRRPRARRPRRHAGPDRARPAARPATRWRSTTRCARCSPTSAPAVPTGGLRGRRRTGAEPACRRRRARRAHRPGRARTGRAMASAREPTPSRPTRSRNRSRSSSCCATSRVGRRTANRRLPGAVFGRRPDPCPGAARDASPDIRSACTWRCCRRSVRS